MKAEETVKDKIRRAKLQLGADFGDEEMMEEAIFKAGIQEVVEYFNEQNDFEDSEVCPYYVMNKKVWQAQLKKWGIK